MESTTNAAPSPGKPDVESVFPGYPELANLRQWARDVRHRIFTLTEQLAGLRKAATGPAQKTQIHQLNNALHRANYERDRVLEKYRTSLTDLAEEAAVDWLRIKSTWQKTEEQTFHLQILQAQCIYLQQGKELFEADSIPALNAIAELEKDIDQFANTNLSSGALFDDPLLHFGQLVGRLSTVLVAAYNEAVDPPSWRSLLENSATSGISYIEIEVAAQTINEAIEKASEKIRERRRDLPGGMWRQGGNLRPEIYAFAHLLYPEDPIHKIDVPETLLYLEDDPNCALRRARLAALRHDQERCAKLIEAYGRQTQLIERARVLAQEGNYRMASDSLRETEEFFSDLNYDIVEQEGMVWKRQVIELEESATRQLDQAEHMLEGVFRRLWFGFGTAQAARAILSSVAPVLAEKTRALQDQRGTDFHLDMETLLARLRERLDGLIRLHRKAERFLQLMSLGAVVGFAAVSVLAVLLILNAIQMQHGQLTVSVKPLLPGETPPTLFLDGKKTLGPTATFGHLKSATYHLLVTAPGYEPLFRTIRLLPAEKLDLPPLELIPLRGFLRFAPSDGAYQYEVRRAGQEPVLAAGSVGANDAASIRLRPGRYDLHLIQGRKDYRTFLDVPLNRVTSYAPDFEFSRVKITTQPQGAILSINGTDLGFTPIELSLPPVDQSVSIRLEGFETYYLPVKPQGGAPLAIHVTLYHVRPKPNPPPPDNTSIPPSIPMPAVGVETNQD